LTRPPTTGTSTTGTDTISGERQAEIGSVPYRVDLTQGGLVGGILRLTWPIMVGALLQTTVQLVDVFMVGRLKAGATAAIAAVGMSGTIMFVMMIVMMAASTGAQVLVSRAFGARDPDLAERATAQSFWILGAASCGIVAPVGFFLARPLLVWTGAAPDVAEVGEPFLQLMFIAAPAMMVNFLFAAVMQGAGDSRTPLIVNAAINAVNIFLNWTLIFGKFGFPALGVTGSALGTLTARSVTAVAAILILSSGRFALTVRWASHARPDLALWGRILRIGVPSGLQGLTRAVSNWLLVRLLATLPGSTPILTGNFIAGQILLITGFIGFSAISAGMTVVGQNMGAGHTDRAESGGWAVVRLAILAEVVPVTCYVLFAPQLIRVIGRDVTGEAVGYGVLALRILALAEPGWATNMALSGAVRAGGDTMSPLRYTLYYQLILGIGGAALLMLRFGAGPAAVWGASLFGHTGQALALVWKFRRGEWRGMYV
jgi:MATE family, multidrug efflux pump